MKILVTGNQGFIGSHLWDELEDIHELVGFDLLDGQDIRNRYQLEFLFETNHFDCIIHLAALTGARRGELFPEEYCQTNIVGTKNLVDMAEKYQVRRFIHFSSSSVLVPSSIYGMTKWISEVLIGRSNISSKQIIRPFTVIGENGRRDQVIMKWLEKIKSKSLVIVHGLDTKRHFTYVKDVVRFTKEILQKELVGQKTFELCNPQEISLKTLLELFKERYPKMVYADGELERYELKENNGQWSALFEATPVIPIIKRLIKHG